MREPHQAPGAPFGHRRPVLRCCREARGRHGVGAQLQRLRGVAASCQSQPPTEALPGRCEHPQEHRGIMAVLGPQASQPASSSQLICFAGRLNQRMYGRCLSQHNRSGIAAVFPLGGSKTVLGGWVLEPGGLGLQLFLSLASSGILDK